MVLHPSKPRLLASAAIALSLWVSTAAAENEDPGEFILSFARQTDKMLQAADGSAAAAPDRFRALLREQVDLAMSLRLIVGRAWDEAEAAQRETMRRAFEDYLVAMFGGRFRGFDGHYPQVRQTRMLANGQAWVITEIPTDGPGKIPVEWRLVAAPAAASEHGAHRWRIVDVDFAGIDAVTTFRESFAAVLKDGGIDRLLKELAAKSQQ